MMYATQEQYTFLAGLSKDEQAGILPHLLRREVPKGEMIFHQGEPGDLLMFIARGRVKISTVSDEGRELSYTQLHVGDFFGEIAILTRSTRSANACALEDSVLYTMSREGFDECLNMKSFTMLILKNLARRLSSSSTHFSSLILYDLYHNVAHVLKSISTPTEINGERCFVVDERPTHQELATMVGSSREVVTRTLRNLQVDRCITMEGRRVIIHRLP
ncbi:MAG: Crp/Fnr family transcriptional regulator [Myxococcota bacterium]|nr:Crp/Fnr family transcriptional regulator [Myxococcota bacterium]